MSRFACLFSCLLLAMVGCQGTSTPPQRASVQSSDAQSPAPPATLPPPELHDVIERDPRYMIGISYPPDINRYPGLAAALADYAGAARAELMQAVEGLGQDKPTVPYDLTLGFNQVVDTPDLVAVAGEGSLYAGGAHGIPLVARFVWLPRQDRMLTANMLVPDPAAWRDIGAYVREQLHTALSERIDADDLPAADRAEILRNGSRMIDDGTGPDPGNFKQFEPLLAGNGKIRALRFVFAPYQVGPYSDGIQSVEVPAAILLPKLAPEWRALFDGS